jgi:hypothetical protein
MAALSRFTERDLYIVVGRLNSLERQKSEGFQFRADTPPWALNMPIDWATNEYANGNWNIQLHFWRMMDPYISEWYWTGDHSLLEEAFCFARDWWRAHSDGTRLRHSWYDMAVGIRALRLALLLEQHRLGRIELNEDDRNALHDMVDAHATELQDLSTLALTNHGIFQAFGLRVLAEVASDRPSLANAVESASNHLEHVIGHLFTPEGIQKEHSPGYHLFVTKIVNTLRLLHWFPNLHGKEAVLRRAHANREWMFFPDGKVSRSGDTSNIADRKATTPPRLIEGSISKEVGGRPIEVSDFASSGWSVARAWTSDNKRIDGMIFMTAMQYGSVHKHADDLSFQLFDRGRPILVDSGNYAFSPTNAMRFYVMSAAAHNTVDLLDRSLERTQTRHYGSGLHPIVVDESAVVLSGEVRGRGKMFDHSRSLRWVPGRSLEIRDRVRRITSESTLVSRLHFAADLVIGRYETFLTIVGAEGFVAKLTPPRAASFRVIRGQENPPLGWVTVEYGKMEPITVVEAALDGEIGESAWLFEFV